MEDTHTILKGLFPSCRKNAKGFYENIPCPTCTSIRDRNKKKRFVYARGLRSSCWICEVPLTWSELTGQQALPQGRFVTPVEEEKRAPHPYATKLPCNGNGVPVHHLPIIHPAVKFLHKDFIYNLEEIYNCFNVLYVPAEQGVVLMTNPLVTSGERLLFPVTCRNETVGWQMRSIPGTALGDRVGCIRYYHLFNKGNYLYNYDGAKQFKIVVVTEGVKKCWKFPNAVATLGKGITDNQLQLLQEWNNIIFLYDGEDGTQAKAIEITQQLYLGGYNALCIDPRKYGFPSPDEMTAEEANNIVISEWCNKYGKYDI